MSAQLTAFLDAAKADTSLQEKLKAAGSPDAAVAIAEEAGFTFSSEDLLKATQDDVELEEWQLEAISGGKGSGVQGNVTANTSGNGLSRGGGEPPQSWGQPAPTQFLMGGIFVSTK